MNSLRCWLIAISVLLLVGCAGTPHAGKPGVIEPRVGMTTRDLREDPYFSMLGRRFGSYGFLRGEEGIVEVWYRPDGRRFSVHEITTREGVIVSVAEPAVFDTREEAVAWRDERALHWEQVEAQFHETQRQQRVEEFLASRPDLDERTRGLVRERRFALGMDAATVEVVMGRPLRVNRSVSEFGVSEQWVYDKLYLHFRDGILSSWHENARP
jgi:hypothetical protein